MDSKKIEDLLKKYEEGPEISKNEDEVLIEKYLSFSERNRYRIHCTKVRNEFPSAGEEITLRRGERTATATMQKRDSMRLTWKGFNALDLKKHERSKIRISKTDEDDVFELEVLEE